MKKLILIGGGILLFIVVIALVIGGNNQTTDITQPDTKQVQNNNPDESVSNVQKVQETSPIEYSTLREWNPDNDLSALGMDVLISKQDTTEENIVKLVTFLASNADKAVLKIYQDKMAWEEEQTSEYTEVYDAGYLAFYVKNLTDNGAYKGLNELRWFQVTGQLEDLVSTTTKL